MNDNLLLTSFARSILYDLGIKPNHVTTKLMIISILNNIPFKVLWDKYNQSEEDAELYIIQITKLR